MNMIQNASSDNCCNPGVISWCVIALYHCRELLNLNKCGTERPGFHMHGYHLGCNYTRKLNRNFCFAMIWLTVCITFGITISAHTGAVNWFGSSYYLQCKLHSIPQPPFFTSFFWSHLYSVWFVVKLLSRLNLETTTFLKKFSTEKWYGEVFNSLKVHNIRKWNSKIQTSKWFHNTTFPSITLFLYFQVTCTGITSCLVMVYRGKTIFD